MLARSSGTPCRGSALAMSESLALPEIIFIEGGLGKFARAEELTYGRELLSIFGMLCLALMVRVRSTPDLLRGIKDFGKAGLGITQILR